MSTLVGSTLLPPLVLVLTILGLVLSGGVTLTDTLWLALPSSLLLLSRPKSEEAMGAMLSNAPLLGLLSLALPVPPMWLLPGLDAASPTAAMTPESDCEPARVQCSAAAPRQVRCGWNGNEGE
jgi:hypothetical protein